MKITYLLRISLIFFFSASIFAEEVNISRPIYFDAGDVKPHQTMVFPLPYQKMQQGVLYDISCQITGIDILKYQPIIYVNITGDKVDNNLNDSLFTSINGLGYKYPFQDHMIQQTNTLVIHNFPCTQCDESTPLKMSVYNFDDNEPVTFSNCFVIVGKENA